MFKCKEKIFTPASSRKWELWKHQWNTWEKGFHGSCQGLHLPGMETAGSLWEQMDYSSQHLHSTGRKHRSLFLGFTINIMLLKITFALFLFTTNCIWILMHGLLSHMTISLMTMILTWWNFLPQLLWYLLFSPPLITEQFPLYWPLQIYVKPDLIIWFSC